MSQLVPLFSSSYLFKEEPSLTMYSDNIGDNKMLEGLNSGVPTRTTPTLTPTTLRNIEQTFIELQCQVESHQNQAGFVPPVVQPPTQGNIFMSLVDTKNWQGGSTTLGESQPSADNSVASLRSAPITATTRRNMGGRRPNKDKNISPEEEERRQMRRERNKLAAARCRKRRLDHTNELIEETEGLEEKKQSLQNEIHQLQMQKEELEFLLEAHKACCRLNNDPESPQDIKPFSLSMPKMLTDVQIKQEPETVNIFPPCPKQEVRPRPTSLPVSSFTPSRKMLATAPTSEVAGVPITTPTAGIPFNFDSLMDGGTGLTPVSGPLVPSCSSQQRNSGCIDLSSPDSVPTKLVSL